MQPKMQLKKSLLFLTVLIILTNLVYADLVAHYSFDGDDMDMDVINDDSDNGNIGTFFNKNTKLLMSFDDGTASDESGNLNDGTINGAVWTSGTIHGATQVGGRVGNALEFDGDDDYVEVPDSPELRLEEHTIEAWIKPTSSVVDWARIVGKGDGKNRNYGLWRHSDGYILCQIYGSPSNVNCLSDNSYPVGEWYHAACTYDGSNVKMYIDGLNVKTCPYTGTPVTSSDPVTIGYAGFHTFFNGIIDEVRIYNRALNDDEITANMNGGSIATDGLVSEHKFENIDGTYTHDTARAVSNGAFEFDGVDDYVSVPNLPNTDELTIEMWIYPQGSVGDFRGLFGNQGWTTGNIHFQIGTDNKIQSAINSNVPPSAFSTTTFDSSNLNRWFHIAVTYDKSEGYHRMYVNGVEEADEPITTAQTITLSNLRIGSTYDDNRLFNGKIDELAIYSKSLTPEEIQDHFIAKKAKFTDWTTGKVGTGLEFDGVNDYVEVLDSSSLHSDRELTVEGWFKLNAFDERWQSIYWKGNPGCGTGCERREYTFWVRNNGLLHFTSTPVSRIGVGQLACNAPAGTIQTNQWYHFATIISADGNYMKTYLNGELKASCGYDTSGIRDTTGPFRIGAQPTVGNSFNGVIDEVKIYDSALTEEQISENYDNAMNPPTTPGSSGYRGGGGGAPGFKPNLITLVIMISSLILLSGYDILRRKNF